MGQVFAYGGGNMAGARRRFASATDAYSYLRYWMGEPAARAELQWILQRSGPSLALRPCRFRAPRFDATGRQAAIVFDAGQKSPARPSTVYGA